LIRDEFLGMAGRDVLSEIIQPRKGSAAVTGEWPFSRMFSELQPISAKTKAPHRLFLLT
jgi:hypothetical protein